MKSLLASLTIVAVLLSTFSCNRYKDMQKASVYDTGNLSNEGCGYLLKMEDGSLQMPQNLPSSFRHHGTEVWVKLKGTGNNVICKTDQVNKGYFELMEVEEIHRKLD